MQCIIMISLMLSCELVDVEEVIGCSHLVYTVSAAF